MARSRAQTSAALDGQTTLVPDAAVAALAARARPPRHRAPAGPAPSDVLAIHADQVRTEDPRAAGPVHVGHQMWQVLTLDAILAGAGLSARARVLTEVMTLNRLVSPAAEHAMPEWIRRTALADILATDFSTLSDEALYRNLERLHPQRAAIEQALAARERTEVPLRPALHPPPEPCPRRSAHRAQLLDHVQRELGAARGQALNRLGAARGKL